MVGMITFESSDLIERTEGGKFRAVISRVPRDAPPASE